jgi:hypothetical protein
LESSTPPAGAKYPVDCPSCKAAAGFPFRASTQSGKTGIIAVEVRCRDCGHEWTCEIAAT